MTCCPRPLTTMFWISWTTFLYQAGMFRGAGWASRKLSNSRSICALGLLGSGIGSCGTGLGSKGGGNPSEIPRPNICFCLMWTNELPLLYICLQKSANIIIGHSRPACTATMRKFCLLWPPRQAINLPSQDIFCFSWARKWTCFCGVAICRQGKACRLFLGKQVVCLESKWNPIFPKVWL